LLLQSLYLGNLVLVLPLQALKLRDGIFLGRQKVALLLVPFGPVGLVGEDELGLFAFGVLALLLKVVVLLLQDLLFSLDLSLKLFDFLFLVSLENVKFFLQTVSLFLDSLDFLLEATLFRHHALVADLKSLVQGVLFLLESADGALKLVDGGSVGFLAFFQLFLKLLLELLEDRVVVVLMLRLALVLGSLELIDGLLELAKSILVVLFGLLLLLLKEFKLAFP